MSQTLAAALAKLLEDKAPVPVSAFTPRQRRALEELARRTGALRVKTVGRGSVYQVLNEDMLTTHLRALHPQSADEIDPTIPKRAANIAQARDSKSGMHRHALLYLLTKAISPGVTWEIEQEDAVRRFDLSTATEIAGAGVLALQEEDTWRSDYPLWLVENQALFNRLDWLPAGVIGTVAYYAGQLPTRLLKWIAARQRAPEIIFFPDYDGVGLHNYARLREASPGPCSFWLMPGWQARLKVFGSNKVWQNTQSDFQSAFAKLETIGMEADLRMLCNALSREGLALEHEAVWLSTANDR